MIGMAHAPSTRRKHTTAWRHWLNFIKLSEFSVPPIRPSEIHVCLFLVYLYRLKKKKFSYHTIRTYLYSLASEIRLRGGKNIVIPYESWFVHTTLGYIRKSLGTATLIFRRPLTTDLLYKVLDNANLSDFNTLVYCCMLAVGVFCLLRIGELCYTVDDKLIKCIRNKDIVFSSSFICFTLWNTKTDQEKRGIKKYVTNISNFKHNPFENNIEQAKRYFLRIEEWYPVSRVMLVTFLQDKMKLIFPQIPSKEWSGISLRKGGATSALRAGIQGEVIEKLGHWKSDVQNGFSSVLMGLTLDGGFLYLFPHPCTS
jgi:hypothetical protein